MAVRFKVTLGDMFANQLKAYATTITRSSLRAAQDVVRDVAIQAHEKAREMASDRLKSTKMQYIRAISFDEKVGLYTITLDKDAAHLEDGYASFDMKTGMLASSAIVKTGKRAGQPWVRTAKDGSKYAMVPFEHNEAAAKSGHPDQDSPVRIGQPQETTKGDLAMDLKNLKQAFGASNTLVGPNGKPIQGKAATWVKSETGPQWTYRDALGNSSTKTVEANPMLSGLTKIQYQVAKRGGGSVDRTAYLTWRAVSSKSDGWIHPGYRGAKIFPDLTQWTNDTLSRRLTELFSQQGK